MRKVFAVLPSPIVLIAILTVPALAANPHFHTVTGGGTVMDSSYDPAHNIHTFACTVQQQRRRT